ncbi:MAG: aminotransferase-like domain-containing protein [Acidimicrobiales bacterium]
MTTHAAPPVYRFARRRSGAGDGVSAILALADPGTTITFSGGFPAPETFPTEVLAGLLPDAVGDAAGVALQYTATEGLAGLRATLRRWLLETQGAQPGGGELMVTSGGIEALSLIARSLVDAGDRVLVEGPTYLGAITAFTGFEALVEAVPTDDDGLDPDALLAALRRGPTPKALYVIPDFQNPTGRWTTTERRLAIVDACRRYGVPVIEDVAYRELAFVPEQRPSLWSLGPDVVAQVGTFSKIFFPGVRLGWAAGAAELVDAMVQAKQNSDQCAGGLGQWLVDRYLAGGHLEPRLRTARDLYAERAAALKDALGRHLPAGCAWTHPQGGFFCWVSAPAGVDTVALVPRAAGRGVAYVPGAPFFPGRAEARHLRLSYSRVTTDQIDEGVRRLGGLLADAIEEAR